MDDLSPREMEHLVLGYEELDPADRAVADSYLGRHPELAARLAWHRKQEALAQDPVPDVLDFQDGDHLEPRDQEAQQESLRRILAGLDLNRNAGEGDHARDAESLSFTAHLRRHAQWVLPLAAVLALAIFLPRGDTDKALLQNLTVSRIELLADGSRGPGQSAPADGVLHTGEAFALDFFLDDDAYVVVYHVGPAGQVSRVYPETITDTMSPHQGGQAYQIPDPAAGETWILGSDTGTESFLVAIGNEIPAGLDQIQIDATPVDRGRVLTDLKTQLESLMDQVDLYEFDHVD